MAGFPQPMPPGQAMMPGQGAPGQAQPMPPGQAMMPQQPAPMPQQQPMQQGAIDPRALEKLKWVAGKLTEILPGFDPASPIARDIRSAIGLLTKHVGRRAPAASVAGQMPQQMMQMMMRSQATPRVEGVAPGLIQPQAGMMPR
jgi:hypothetical protein